jgi:UDP-sulfoquinovose synthase
VNILVLGGDGYLGWPTALYLSRRGHRIGVVDNFARRGYDLEMGVDSLVPIVGLQQRVRRWQEISGFSIEVFAGDVRTRGGGPLRRATISPVLDDRPQARRVHPGE